MKKNNFLFPAALAALILSDPALAAEQYAPNNFECIPRRISFNRHRSNYLGRLQNVVYPCQYSDGWRPLPRRLFNCRSSLAGGIAGGLNGNIEPFV